MDRIRSGALWTIAFALSLASALLSVSSIASAQNVATCPSASSGAWGSTFLPCSVSVTYVAPAQLATAGVIATQRASVNQWQPFSGLLSTDAVWTDTIQPGTTTQWWPVSAIPGMPAVSGTPASPPTSPTTPVATTTGTGIVTVTWTAPTTNTDGTPLTNLTGYVVQYGQGNFANSQTAPASATSAVLTGVLAGAFQGQVIAVSSSGQSAPSNTATTTVEVPAAPGAPAAQSASATLVTTATPVYLVTNIPSGFGFTQVGTVPLGSPCIATQAANQYNSVDQTKVTVSWSSAIQAINAVALCH